MNWTIEAHYHMNSVRKLRRPWSKGKGLLAEENNEDTKKPKEHFAIDPSLTCTPSV